MFKWDLEITRITAERTVENEASIIIAARGSVSDVRAFLSACADNLRLSPTLIPQTNDLFNENGTIKGAEEKKIAPKQRRPAMGGRPDRVKELKR